MNLPPNERIPIRLGKEPLVEAVWEVRFDGGESVGSALPGILYEKYHRENPDLKVQTLPLVSMPGEVRSLQPSFRYMPTHSLKVGSYVVFTGDHVVALSVSAPYPGWSRYGAAICRLADWLQESGLVRTPTQFSLRYTDFFEGDRRILGNFRLALKAGSYEPSEDGFQFQMGIKLDGLAGAVQMAFPAQMTHPESRIRTGLVTHVQATWTAASETSFWDQYGASLGVAKAACHKVFFNLLTDEAIKAMDPIYGA